MSRETNGSAVWRRMKLLGICLVALGVSGQLLVAQGSVASREADAATAKEGQALLARLVTANATHVSRRQAIALLAKAANLVVQYRVELLNAFPGVVDVHVTNVPLGVALEQVLSGTTLRVVPDAGTRLMIIASNVAADSVPSVGTISGRVLDSASGKGMGGATIKVQGTKLTAVSSDSGRFTIREVPVGNQVLSVRLFGYRPVLEDVTVGAGEAVSMRVRIVAVPNLLSGVVTTATGVQQKMAVGNDITTLNVDSIQQVAPITSVTDLLEARVPGLTVQHSSGVPGDPSRIRLRGVSSITGNNDPIIVVDGIRVYSTQSDPRNNNLAQSSTFNGGASRLQASNGTSGDGSPTYAAPSPLDQIDPNNIETIEVFKGPSASAMYGSDAANGVIVITTKRGRAGPTQWNLALGAGVNWLPGQWPANYYRFGYDSTGMTANGGLCEWSDPNCALDSLVSFQALNESRYSVFTHGHGQTASLSVSGGVPVLRYSITGSAAGDVGNLKLPAIEVQRYEQFYGQIPQWMVHPGKYRTWGIGGQLTAQPVPAMQVTLSSTLLNSAQQRSSLEQAIAQLQGVYISNGTIAGGKHGFFGRPQSLTNIPLIENEVERATDDALTSTNALSLTWQPYPWLPLSVTGGLNTIQRTDQTYVPYGVNSQGPSTCGLLGACEDTNGSYGLGRGTSQDKTVNLGTSLPSRWLTTAIGVNYHSSATADLRAYTNQLAPGVSIPNNFPTNGCGNSTAGAGCASFSQSTFATSTYGWYVEPRLNFQSRFFIAPGFRLDGGSASGAQGGFSGSGLTGFPKIDFSWIAVDRDRPRGVLTMLRPRVAFGLAGTQPGPTEKLRLLNQGGGQIVALNGSTLLPAVDISTLGNTHLRPETSRELEGGADVELWQGRFSLTLSQYDKTRHNAIISLPLAPSVIGGMSQYVNVGVVRNTGTEVSTTIQLFQSRALGWTVVGNFSTDNNRVVRLDPSFTPNQVLGIVAGYPLFSIWQKPIAAYADANQNGRLDCIGGTPPYCEVVLGDSMVYVGQPVAKYQANFSSTLTLLDGRLSINTAFAYQNGLTQNNQAALKSQTINFLVNAPGSSLATQAAVIAASSPYNDPIGVIQTVNTFRFSNLSVNYTLPKGLSQWFHVPRMAVALQGSNLALHTNYRGKDPDVNAFSAVAVSDQTADLGQIPEPRTWWLKLNLGN